MGKKKKELKKKARKSLDLIGRTRLYFFRGHNSWLYLPIWFVNILIVFYKLLLEDLYFLPEWVSFWNFAIIFSVIYFPLAVLVGRLDYYRGTYKGEAEVGMAVNPIWIRQFKELEGLKTELAEIKELLAKSGKD
ncbi:MAG: hypothetical protein GOP50_05395 [Candidatus Heimdallarchaeota archaeon]|nr:hypothetical protein [Candidatus Heimdallarchaeota archaeon]